MTPEPSKPTSAPLGISTRLGWISFFNDASGEALSRALPLVLTAGLGATPAFVGLVEGLAEAVSIALKAVSGWISDRMTSRKPLVAGGYLLSFLAKVLYLALHLPGGLGLARVLDRVGKGLRSAPRDAMVADAAAVGALGREFGLNRMLDTLGALTGLLLVLLLGLGHGPMDAPSFRKLVLLALPAGFVAVLLVFLWLPRVPRTVATKPHSWSIPKEIRGYLVLVLLFGLANSSDAFLVLRAKELGFTFREILGLLLLFNLLAALLALPAGRWSDRTGRVRFLAAGWAVYGLAYGAMALSPGRLGFAAALLAYGAFYGLTEGVEKALLGDLLHPEHRGMGYGAFQLALGLAALAASLLMGWMWSTWGSGTAFRAAAAIALLAAALLAGWAKVRRISAA